MKTALVSFLYPKARPYWPDAFQSITRQSDPDFDTIVVNDNFGTIEHAEKVRILDNVQALSPLALRQHVFNILLDEGYDLLISLDSDDTMSADRVEKTKKAHKDYPEVAFYYSDLHDMADPEKHFFEVPDSIHDIKDIFFSNCMGLSHMSLNLRFLRQTIGRFFFPENVIALDWYLAASFLLSGFSGQKTQGLTYYRLYDDNLAGKTSEATFEKALRILTVKISHYEAIESLIKDQKYKVACALELTRLKALLNGPESVLKASLCNRKPDATNHWWAGY
ncbi:glycosyltransferase family A protein [Kordiimonas sp.]|uniref:glycosyltransferase family A protein n=1 Tax=Kordiimonas sp. TaxID=1970157 RepID=UPI003A8F8815